MLTQDWMMKQIETTLLALARFIFQKDGPNYCPSGLPEDGEIDAAALRLSALVEEGRFSEAEDKLFELMEEGDSGSLELALDFYARLNDLSDARLEAGGFSRSEIQEGIRDAMDQFGVVLP